jgi:large subunit ribosomal protein L18e
MLRTIRSDNPELVRTLLELKRAAKAHKAPIWGALADELARPRHQHTPVNVGHLERLTAADEIVVVPGKVLAAGSLSKALTVGAFNYSAEARLKIHNAGGKALTIDELLKSKPDGTGVRLLG